MHTRVIRRDRRRSFAAPTRARGKAGTGVGSVPAGSYAAARHRAARTRAGTLRVEAADVARAGSAPARHVSVAGFGGVFERDARTVAPAARRTGRSKRPPCGRAGRG